MQDCFQSSKRVKDLLLKDNIDIVQYIFIGKIFATCSFICRNSSGLGNEPGLGQLYQSYLYNIMLLQAAFIMVNRISLTYYKIYKNVLPSQDVNKNACI